MISLGKISQVIHFIFRNYGEKKNGIRKKKQADVCRQVHVERNNNIVNVNDNTSTHDGASGDRRRDCDFASDISFMGGGGRERERKSERKKNK